MTPACFPRSKASTGAILDALDVEHRKEWLPFNGVTHCNTAVERALLDLGCRFPRGLLANDQQEWLGSDEGRAAGWEECTAARAGDCAELGFPTVVTLREPVHGHVAFVRARDEHGTLRIWQAGRLNLNDAPLRAAFTLEQLGRVKFFSHP